MDARRTVYDALKALKDSGLVTDRDRLNAAWQDLTQPQEDDR